MSKGRKIVLGILSFILIILLLVIFYYVIYLPSNRVKVYHNKEISVCREGINCGYSDLKFTFIKSDYNSSVLQDKIDEVNQMILKDYRKVKKSRLSFSECGPVAAAYQHSMYIQDTIHVYEDNDYVIFSLISSESNLCTEDDSDSYEKVITYFFDKKKNKFLSENEFKKIIKLDDNSISDLVSLDISSLRELGNDYVVNKNKPYQIYVLEDGSVMIYYYVTASNVGHSILSSSFMK